MKVGFIGLGQMGSAMAANLVKAGHAVTVWNRSPGKDDALVAAGAVLADTPAAAAQGDVVMTMLADDRAAESVLADAVESWTVGGLPDAAAVAVRPLLRPVQSATRAHGVESVRLELVEIDVPLS